MKIPSFAYGCLCTIILASAFWMTANARPILAEATHSGNHLSVSAIIADSTYQQLLEARFKQISDISVDLSLLKEIDTLSANAVYKYPHVSTLQAYRGRFLVRKADIITDPNTKKLRFRQESDAMPLSTESKDSYRKARYHLIRAIALDNTTSIARWDMLKVETALEEYASALVFCNELLEEEPYDAGLWKKKIALYRKLGNQPEVNRLTERYMSIYPEDKAFQQGLADELVRNIKEQRKKGDYTGMEANLRKTIALHDSKPAYYYSLLNLLISEGKPEEALEVAGTAAKRCMGYWDAKNHWAYDIDTIHVKVSGVKDSIRIDTLKLNSRWFVEKRAKILFDLNRAQEARNYLQNMKMQYPSLSLDGLINESYMEVAREAQFNDPYEAHAYAYGKTKSQESLDYLIKTSMQRGYYEAALEFLADAIKRYPTKNTVYLDKRYFALKKLNHRSKAEKLLVDTLLKMNLSREKRYDYEADYMQLTLDRGRELMDEARYSEAADELMKAYQFETQNDFSKEKQTVLSRIYSCVLNLRKLDEAKNVMDSIKNPKDIVQHILIYADLYQKHGKTELALNKLFETWERVGEKNDLLEVAYEEKVVPHVKSLIDTHRILAAEEILVQAYKILPVQEDLLHYGITTAQLLKDDNLLSQRIKIGLENYPNDSYYTIKQAQQLQREKKYDVATKTLRQLFDQFIGDTLINNLYAENNYLLVDTLLKNTPQPRWMDAKEHAKVALEILPDHPLNHKAMGQVYEAMSKVQIDADNLKGMYPVLYKDSAYYEYRRSAKAFDSEKEYNRVTRQLYNDSRHNELSFEYQHGKSGEDATSTGNAYLSYKHITNRANEWTLGISYAGRSGLADAQLTDYNKGGLGFRFAGAYLHNFNATWAMEGEFAWANHYFPTLSGRLSLFLHLKNEWDITLKGIYRRLKIYSGQYQQSSWGEEFEILEWQENNANMLQGGLDIAKQLNQFRLSAGTDGFLLQRKFYINCNAKCQFYPTEGSKNHVFVAGGLGTAPDGAMLDRAHSVSFNDLNGYISMGGYVLLNNWLGMGLSGTWYTLYNQSEKPSTSPVPSIQNSYKNYFYLNASMNIKF